MRLFNWFHDNPEKKFWHFFSSKIDTLADFRPAETNLAEINHRLNDLFPGLGLGVLINFENGKQKTCFYITAYGDKTKFPTIEKLVKLSPKAVSHQVIDFSPPSYLRDTLTFNGKTIPTENIELNWKKNMDELDLTLYVFPKPSRTDDEFNYALQTLLISFLGEVQFVRLGYIDILDLNDKKKGHKTEKLANLDNILANVLK